MQLGWGAGSTQSRGLGKTFHLSLGGQYCHQQEGTNLGTAAGERPLGKLQRRRLGVCPPGRGTAGSGRSRGLTETGHSPVPFHSLTQHLMESSRPTCDSGMIENPPTRTLRPRAAPRGLGSTAETQTLAPADSGHARNRRSYPAWALRGAGNQGCSSLLETIDTPHWGCTE